MPDNADPAAPSQTNPSTPATPAASANAPTAPAAPATNPAPNAPAAPVEPAPTQDAAVNIPDFPEPQPLKITAAKPATPPASATPAQPAAAPVTDFNGVVESLRAELRAERAAAALEQAERTHNASLAAEKSVIDDAFKSAVPSDAPPAVREQLQRLYKANIHNARSTSLYPVGHPLADHAFAPLPETTVRAIAKQVNETYALIKGEVLKSIAANGKPVPNTPAGTPGSGLPTPSPAAGQSGPTQDQRIARFRQLMSTGSPTGAA